MQKKFSRLYREACQPENQISIDPHEARLVIFSDHHKGDNSGADDFKKNAALYTIALNYYAEHKFKLIVLGDSEELWENSMEQVLEHYESLIRDEITLALEGPDGKKIRIWGNHDKEVSLRWFRWNSRKLSSLGLEKIDYRECLCLGPDIFLIHGHQGRFFEDKAWRLSRWAVQFIWKTIQKILHIGIDGPAENFALRENLEMNYYLWAKAKKVLLICGHTHQAIFSSLTHYDRLQLDIKRLESELSQMPSEQRSKLTSQIADKQQHIQEILWQSLGYTPRSFETPAEQSLPCYFNSGCCGYTNGITCLEIDMGEIRLIKWRRDTKRRRVLVQDDLQTILNTIKAAN
ncbi:MAG: hypothetical protein GQ544_01565 [Candidatus Aminicenantes bacterium]|nr:hypothetical protein [Candidatus Aminicenantes bacterium]